MAKDNSFDIVSEFDMQEVNNALNQAKKELQGRFDFKNSKSEIKHSDNEIIVISDDEFKLKNVTDIIESKFVKRNLSLKTLKYGRIEPAAGDTVKQLVTLQQGISKELAKDIIKIIKDTKLKVQASIQGDQIRVSGAKRDDLQAVIQTLKGKDLEVDLQFINFR